jgi:hypothetical protein
LKAGDQRAVLRRGGQIQRHRHAGRHRLSLNPQIAPDDVAELLQLRGHAFDRVRWNGKPDPYGAPGGRHQSRVDADNLSVLGKERSAGIALVDRRIHLNE